MAVMGSGIGRGVGEPGFEDDNITTRAPRAARRRAIGGAWPAPDGIRGARHSSSTLARGKSADQSVPLPLPLLLSRVPQLSLHQIQRLLSGPHGWRGPQIPEDGNVSSTPPNPISSTTPSSRPAMPSTATTARSTRFNQPRRRQRRVRRCPDLQSGDEPSEGAFGACPDGLDDLAAFTSDLSYAGATGWLTTEVPVVGAGLHPGLPHLGHQRLGAGLAGPARRLQWIISNLAAASGYPRTDRLSVAVLVADVITQDDLQELPGHLAFKRP